jgi:hypothetical protein
MRSYRPLYGNPADIVPPGFEGHEQAWGILSSKVGLTASDVMLPSPSLDVNALMALIQKFESRIITEAQFIDSVKALMPAAPGELPTNLGVKEIPSILKSLPADADDAWAAISQGLNLSVSEFERLFDINYAAMLHLLALQYLQEEISEERFVAEVRNLMQMGQLVSQPLGPTPGVIPTEFAVSGLDFAWQLLEQEGVTIAQWNTYDARTKDLILAKANIFMSLMPITESGIQEYLEYALNKMRQADLAMFSEEGVFDLTTQPEFVGPPAPPEEQLALRGVIETALKFEFPNQPEITRHDIYSFLEDVGLRLQASNSKKFDVPTIQKVIKYFKFLGFPDYRPTELAAIMSLVYSDNFAILDAERTAMAVDNNRPDALSQPINGQIVLAMFGQSAYNALKKFCAQPIATRANDIVEFYENDLNMILGVDPIVFNQFVLSNFDARVSGQLIEQGATAEDRIGKEQAARAAQIASQSLADQASAVRAPTSRTQAFKTSGAHFAGSRANYSVVKASLVIGGFAIGIGVLSHKIWHNKR